MIHRNERKRKICRKKVNGMKKEKLIKLRIQEINGKMRNSKGKVTGSRRVDER